jgi:hypothetical protein
VQSQLELVTDIVVDIETSSPAFATMNVPSTPTVWAMVGSRNDDATYTVTFCAAAHERIEI